MYGGTVIWASTHNVAWGLSPRVRGNPRPVRTRARPSRSIPACTGEPPKRPARHPGTPVYPRVYGGTTRKDRVSAPSGGLSPRVRGNRSPAFRNRSRLWSIPACTGEPGMPCLYRRRTRVYPRVYGGTITRTASGNSSQGLSPRVRGNPLRHPYRRLAHGSIPACTGEPVILWAMSRSFRVYPRVYGGTLSTQKSRRPGIGLSPRVRGNPGPCRRRTIRPWSIPACTGEPSSWGRRVKGAVVYPRVYGGTLRYRPDG